MIQLFKKVRRKLLTNNRLRSYFFYAVGEIVLVMLGIVLALQFSNWNQKRTEIKKEIWYLDNIANDMFAQKQDLVSLKKAFTETLEISNQLLRDYIDLKDYTKIDSLSVKLNNLMVTYAFPNIDNTYSELLSSGQVQLIENDDLLSEIIDYYLTTEENEILFQTNEKQVFYGEVYHVLNKYAEIDLSDYADDESFLAKDETVQNYILTELRKPRVKLELTNAIKNKIIIVKDYLETVDESVEWADKMIKAIDDEIETLK
ncbi:MAG: hypothetical protein CMB99_07525 [Flavobacteriaceae bacterium]|nr:hypothetical protein [Flavobacteriaceae bacterium]|tara:strand:+ start:93632 stop:94408 length:777 start_codon:yes stop_codon:yes gene_type:complete